MKVCEHQHTVRNHSIITSEYNNDVSSIGLLTQDMSWNDDGTAERFFLVFFLEVFPFFLKTEQRLLFTLAYAQFQHACGLTECHADLWNNYVRFSYYLDWLYCRYSTKHFMRINTAFLVRKDVGLSLLSNCVEWKKLYSPNYEK